MRLFKKQAAKPRQEPKPMTGDERREFDNLVAESIACAWDDLPDFEASPECPFCHAPMTFRKVFFMVNKSFSKLGRPPMRQDLEMARAGNHRIGLYPVPIDDMSLPTLLWRCDCDCQMQMKAAVGYMPDECKSTRRSDA